MKLEKARRRDKNRHKDMYGMAVRGRSIHILQEILRKKAEKLKTLDKRNKIK